MECNVKCEVDQTHCAETNFIQYPWLGIAVVECIVERPLHGDVYVSRESEILLMNEAEILFSSEHEIRLAAHLSTQPWPGLAYCGPGRHGQHRSAAQSPILEPLFHFTTYHLSVALL